MRGVMTYETASRSDLSPTVRHLRVGGAGEEKRGQREAEGTVLHKLSRSTLGATAVCRRSLSISSCAMAAGIVARRREVISGLVPKPGLGTHVERSSASHGAESVLC